MPNEPRDMSEHGDDVWRGLLGALAARDRAAVFIDDATLTRDQLPALTADCETWTAIVFRPGAWARVHNTICTRLRTIVESGRELHTGEIVGRRPPWDLASVDHRRSVLRTYATVIAAGAARVYFLACRRDHFDVLRPRLQAARVPGWTRLGDHKSGGLYLAVMSLADRLPVDFPAARFTIVTDSVAQTRNIARPTFVRGSAYHDDSLFVVDSHLLPGLQLADLAAYAHQRELHRERRHRAGESPGPFDDIFGGLVRALASRRVDVEVSIDAMERALRRQADPSPPAAGLPGGRH